MWRPIRGRECVTMEKEVGQRRETPRDAEQGDEGKDQRDGKCVGISSRHPHPIPTKNSKSKNGRNWGQSTLDQFLL